MLHSFGIFFSNKCAAHCSHNNYWFPLKVIRMHLYSWKKLTNVELLEIPSYLEFSRENMETIILFQCQTKKDTITELIEFSWHDMVA